MKNQRGFTLIELVVVIIILGVLAAVAIPKFIDMSTDAHNAAAKGVAGALASGSTINYAAHALNPASGTAFNTTGICGTAGLPNLRQLLTGTTVTLTDSAPLDDQTFQVSANGTDNCTSNSVANVICNITPRGTGVTAAQATILCARP